MINLAHRMVIGVICDSLLLKGGLKTPFFLKVSQVQFIF